MRVGATCVVYRFRGSGGGGGRGSNEAADKAADKAVVKTTNTGVGSMGNMRGRAVLCGGRCGIYIY